MTAHVRIDVKTTNPSNGSGGMTRGARFAAAALRKRQRSLAKAQCAAQAGPWLRAHGPGAVVVTVTRVAPSKGLDAHDNLRSAMKACVDGIADWLGCPDNDPRITWRYDQRRGRQGEYAVEIRIEARDEVLHEAKGVAE